MFCFIPRIAAVILLVVAGTLAPAAAEDRPFSASGAGNVDVDYYDFYGQMYALGVEVMHLGRSNLFVDLEVQDVLVKPYSGGITSANGDFLRFQFDPGLDYFEPAGIVSATVTFTGGTGRFQDATGSADVMFVFDPDLPRRFLFLIDGTIDY